jgi:tetratricopeptide (TPR) repeat protein
MLSVYLSVVIEISGCASTRRVSERSYQHAVRLVEDGTTQLRSGNLEQADALFGLAYEIAPLAAALDGQGCVAFRRGDLERAEALFIDAYRMDAGYDEGAAHLALLLEVRGERDRALEIYDWYLRRHPDDWWARNNRAAAWHDVGVDGRAVEAELRRAAALSQQRVVEDNLQRLSRGAQSAGEDSDGKKIGQDKRAGSKTGGAAEAAVVDSQHRTIAASSDSERIGS